MKTNQISRRRFLSFVGAGSAAAAVASTGVSATLSLAAPIAQTTPQTQTGFKLPPLPYAYDALEPFIDARTMFLHHTAHHGASVTSLNTALKDSPDLLQRDIVDLLAHLSSLPTTVQTAVRNAGGSHLNHSIFWAIMQPKGGGQPVGALAQDINATFGNFDTLRAGMSDTASKVFGSGWAWLVLNSAGKLQVISRPNQDAPVMDGFAALAGIDVFEHAYYLKYQNRRAEYIAAWWNTLNWDAIGKRYDQAKASQR